MAFSKDDDEEKHTNEEKIKSKREKKEPEWRYDFITMGKMFAKCPTTSYGQGLDACGLWYEKRCIFIRVFFFFVQR